MIGKNWIKALAVTGAAAAVALPLISNASTHYTGKVPASIAMMAASPLIPMEPAVTHHTTTKKAVHHTAVKKTAVKKPAAKKTKHPLKKKHIALTAKKKHTM